MIGRRVRVVLKNGETFDGVLHSMKDGPTVYRSQGLAKYDVTRFFPMDTISHIDDLGRVP